jgi:hypothetical protein
VHAYDSLSVTRPLALIDVDGVLSPYGATTCPPGYEEHELFPGEELVRVHPGHGRLLQQLSEFADLTWATSWDEEANRLLAPLLGLDPLPVIQCHMAHLGHYDKFSLVVRGVQNQPLVWFDDLHSAAAVAWAAAREHPTRLIHVDPAVGLASSDIDLARDFLQAVAAR